MTFTESKRDTAASIESEEAFQHSLAELSHQLASRRVPEPPEFPIAPDDDDAGSPTVGHRWRRPAIVAALIVALLAGFYSFRGSAPSPSAPAPAPPREANVVPPPPPTGPAPPKTSDFAVAPPPPVEAKPAIAPPPPVEEQPPAKSGAPLDNKGVQEVQTRLQSLGISPGPIDGIPGPLTRGAARRYETSKGQTASGNVDDALLRQLRSESAR